MRTLPLPTSSSPTTSSLKHPPLRPRFQAGILKPEAIQGLIVDTLGILGPKLVVARGDLNRKEEWALEGLEDIAFYFAVPLAGQYAFAPLFKRLASSLGHNLPQLSIGKALTTANQNNPFLLGAKASTLLATIAVAAGLEYMVPHIKNVITAKAYNTKNFTAVANLETARTEVKKGEVDPVQKARKRVVPVIATMAGLIGAATLLPALVIKNGGLRQAANFFVKHFDFGRSSAFDMSKPILAILALVGLGGYMDAARSKLELKEVATRVAVFTIPYYLFGKELVGNALARILQNQFVKEGGKRIRIKQLVPFLDAKLPKTSFLDFNKVISDVDLVQKLDKLRLSAAVKSAIIGKHQFLNYAKFGLSALIVGVLANLVAYHQTRKSHEKEQQLTFAGQQEKPSPARPITKQANTLPAFKAYSPQASVSATIFQSPANPFQVAYSV